MSLLSLKHKDKKKRCIFKKNEMHKFVLRALSVHLILPLYLREYMFLILQSFGHSSKTNWRNRCVFSNKARYVFTKYRASSLALKRLLVRGKVMGVHKSSW